MDKQTQFLELKKQANKIVDKLSKDNFVVLGALAVSDSCERFNTYLRDHGVDPVDVYHEIGTTDVTVANLFGDVVTNWADGLDGFGKASSIEKEEDIEVWGGDKKDKPSEFSTENDTDKWAVMVDGNFGLFDTKEEANRVYKKVMGDNKHFDDTPFGATVVLYPHEKPEYKKFPGDEDFKHEVGKLSNYTPIDIEKYIDSEYEKARNFVPEKGTGNNISESEFDFLFNNPNEKEKDDAILKKDSEQAWVDVNHDDPIAEKEFWDNRDKADKIKDDRNRSYLDDARQKELSEITDPDVLEEKSKTDKNYDWWGKMSPEQKAAYLEEHKRSKKQGTYKNKEKLIDCFKRNAKLNDTDRAMLLGSKDDTDLVERLKKTSIWTDPMASLQFLNDVFEREMVKVAAKAGDSVDHGRFGKGTIESVDDKTYSIPMVVVKLENGERIARPLSEFKEVGNKNKEQKSVAFKNLSEDLKAKAKELYIKDTGDKDESERGWENYYYDIKTGELTGDDEINLSSEPKDTEKVNRKNTKDTFTMDAPKEKEPENALDNSAIAYNESAPVGERFGTSEEEIEEEKQWNLDHPQVERTPEQNKKIKENFDKIMNDDSRFNFGDEGAAGAAVPKPTPDAPVAGGNAVNSGWWNKLTQPQKMEYIKKHKRTKKQGMMEMLHVTASLIKKSDMSDFELSNIENGIKQLAGDVLSGEDIDNINLYATIRKSIDNLKSQKMLAHEQDGYRMKGIVANV